MSTTQEDRFVPLLRAMRLDDMTFDARTQAMTMELDRRFSSAERARDSYGKLWRADALIHRLVARDFERRIKALKRQVQDLEGRR